LREIGRLQQGFYPTQPRIVAAIAKLIKPGDGSVSIVDAGCGEGAAIRQLKECWGNPSNVKLYGVESDKGRADVAEKVLEECLWANIEDCRPSAGVSCLWFNPPYGDIRDEGRMEEELFDQVKDWPMRKKGLLVLVIQKSVLKDKYGIARKIEQHFSVDAVFDYPMPEREEFGQCVLIGKRRDQDKKSWDSDPAGWQEPVWPVLPLDPPRHRWTLWPSSGNVALRRVEVPDALLRLTTDKSPLKHALLREALLPEPPLARPPLPLRAGHTALMLAGGLCDCVMEDAEHGKFMVKGTLEVSRRKVKSEDKLDNEGNPCAIVDFWRTNYALKVKALRDTGNVEVYSSESAEAPVETGQDEQEE
jgi:hypothetical protein